MASRKKALLALTILPLLFLSGCYTIREDAYTLSAIYDLRHSWSPGVAIENGRVNSCVQRPSYVSGRAHICRVVDGYEEAGDRRNWTIRYTSGHPDGFEATDPERYGITIMVGGDGVFEGCRYAQAGGDEYWFCDYRVRKHVVLTTSGCSSWCWNYVLRVAWNWASYAGNTMLGCGVGIAGVMGGLPVTAPLLWDCKDGPL